MAIPSEAVETVVINKSESESKSDYSKLVALDDCDSVLIKQPIRNKELLMEMFCGYEMQNLYTIQSVNQQQKSVTQLFTLKEDSNCFLRQWYGMVYKNFIYVYGT